MSTPPQLTEDVLKTFVHGYLFYTRTQPNPAITQALADMLVRAWPSLDPRSKEWIAELPQVLYEAQGLTEEARKAENARWTGVFGVVQGCVGLPDPEVRAQRLTETMGYW